MSIALVARILSQSCLTSSSKSAALFLPSSSGGNSFARRALNSHLYGKKELTAHEPLPPSRINKLLRPNDLQTVPGAFRRRLRVGRGIGSGLGKNSGYGHQKSRSTPRAFEGGQTPMYKRFPKIGFTKPNQVHTQTISLEKLQRFIDMGRLKAKDKDMLSMRDFLVSGIVSDVKDGIKILATGKEAFASKVHLEVSAASREAILAIEKAGGTVTCVHFNRLALRALLQPYKFDLLPRRARPNPSVMPFYLERLNCGYLAPEIQLRNMMLFGYNTTEERYRKEFDRYREKVLEKYRVEREKLLESFEDNKAAIIEKVVRIKDKKATRIANKTRGEIVD